MAFIVKKREKYFELLRNVRKDGKHKRELLHYMGSDLSIPSDIVERYNISPENIARLKNKYPALKIGFL